jgi:DNA-binding YbaB/EbfC family protein
MTMNPLDLVKGLQKAQEQFGDFQDKLAEFIVTGVSGGGMVEIDMNGKFDVLAVRISKDAVGLMVEGVEGAVAEPDVEMLGDLVAAAFSAAQEKVRQMVQGEAGNIAQMMGLPSGIMDGLSNQ